AATDEVCIQGGEFTMGHDPVPCLNGRLCDPTGNVRKDFAPPHKVRLPPFFVDQLPVTNGQYKQCLDAAVCPNECQPQCSGGVFDEYHLADPQLAAYPVLTISADGAAAYCAFVGK